MPLDRVQPNQEMAEAATLLEENALTVLRARYLRRNLDSGAICETPEKLFRRVAHAVAGAETPLGGAVAEWEE